MAHFSLPQCWKIHMARFQLKSQQIDKQQDSPCQCFKCRNCAQLCLGVLMGYTQWLGFYVYIRRDRKFWYLFLPWYLNKSWSEPDHVHQTVVLTSPLIFVLPQEQRIPALIQIKELFCKIAFLILKIWYQVCQLHKFTSCFFSMLHITNT